MFYSPNGRTRLLHLLGQLGAAHNQGRLAHIFAHFVQALDAPDDDALLGLGEPHDFGEFLRENMGKFLLKNAKPMKLIAHHSTGPLVDNFHEPELDLINHRGADHFEGPLHRVDSVGGLDEIRFQLKIKTKYLFE
jgi:hypothetical protein